MRGNPWTSIHPSDANFPVGEPSSEFIDCGCFDSSGPCVIMYSPQVVAHNSYDTSAFANVEGYNPNLSIIHTDNLRVLPRDTLVPYFDAGTTVEDIIVTARNGDFTSVRTLRRATSRCGTTFAICKFFQRMSRQS